MRSRRRQAAVAAATGRNLQIKLPKWKYEGPVATVLPDLILFRGNLILLLKLFLTV